MEIHTSALTSTNKKNTSFVKNYTRESTTIVDLGDQVMLKGEGSVSDKNTYINNEYALNKDIFVPKYIHI